MSDYNRYEQMGRLTRDPELRYTSSGTPVASFCVATTTHWGAEAHQKDQAFVNWAFFGKRGERIVEYFSKGDPIFIVGRLKTNQWESQGQKHSRLEAVGEDWKFVGNTQKTKAGATIPVGQQPTQPQPYSAPAPVQNPPDPDDIPF